MSDTEGAIEDKRSPGDVEEGEVDPSAPPAGNGAPANRGSPKRNDDATADKGKGRSRRSSRSSSQPRRSRNHSRSRSRSRSVSRRDDRRRGDRKRSRSPNRRSRRRYSRSRSRSRDRRSRRRDSRDRYSRKGDDRRRGAGRGGYKGDKKEQGVVKLTEAEAKERAMKSLSSGVYVPPARMRLIQGEVQDKKSQEYQRMRWDALRKSINGLVNKVNTSNIVHIVKDLFRENLIRGRGLLARSVMKAQAVSPTFTKTYAALIAVLNTKLPEVGELILKRLVSQFQKAFKRNNKPLCTSSIGFIAHFVNQHVAHEILALQILTLLLETPTDDSVELAVEFTKECGAALTDLSPQGVHAIFERFRGILHEGEISKRVQYMIEGIFHIRQKQFEGFPQIEKGLDLVDAEDQITHELYLDSDDMDLEQGSNLFKHDPDWEENEKAWGAIRREVLGEGDAEGSDSEYETDTDASEDGDGDGDAAGAVAGLGDGGIIDETETNLVNLRRTIYLTIMSSVDFEECAHKLMKLKIAPGQEIVIAEMLLECCMQERTYLRFYGLLGQRFCMMNRIHQENFDHIFAQQYSTIHRLETNKLRNVAKLFAHLLHTDALPWTALEYVHLSEEETTSSSRIFVKILFQEIAESMGLAEMNKRLNDDSMQEFFGGLMPRDNPRNTRFAINFFTSIGLGGLTVKLREHLKNAQAKIMTQKHDDVASDSSSSISSSTYSSSGYSTSYSYSYSSSKSGSRARRGARDSSARRSKTPPKGKKTGPDSVGKADRGSRSPSLSATKRRGKVSSERSRSPSSYSYSYSYSDSGPRQDKKKARKH